MGISYVAASNIAGSGVFGYKGFSSRQTTINLFSGPTSILHATIPFPQNHGLHRFVAILTHWYVTFLTKCSVKVQQTLSRRLDIKTTCLYR
jgi:hypothetical protein